MVVKNTAAIAKTAMAETIKSPAPHSSAAQATITLKQIGVSSRNRMSCRSAKWTPCSTT